MVNEMAIDAFAQLSLGATALGPALQLGIDIAGERPRSSVILCTDGLANGN